MFNNFEQENHDPTKASPFNRETEYKGSLASKDLEIEEVKRNRLDVYYDNENKEVFYNKIKEGEGLSRREYFIALLLKGALQVSDIVEREDGKLISREIKLEDIQEKYSAEAINAESFLLMSLLGDDDHAPVSNVNIRTGDDAFVHFDYEQAFDIGRKVPTASQIVHYIRNIIVPSFEWDTNTDSTLEEKAAYFKDLPKEDRRKATYHMYLDTKKFISEVQKRIDPLRSQFQDINFMKAVLEKSKMDISEVSYLEGETDQDKLKDLQQLLLARLDVLDEVADIILNDKE